MVREKKSNNNKNKCTEKQEQNPETQERKRLKKLAHTNKLLSETAPKVLTQLAPTKTVIKHHGKDVAKKSQRRNRYLFSFSGLLAPVSGGKIGELTDLGSKNPKLYLEFPQGRMKLFGTIVYPKNRYLTLQFSRGGKNVMCEDCFDTMIVFSDACWVGKKDENPDEVRLDFPEELYEGKQSEFDFQGGAGATAMKSKDVKKVVSRAAAEESSPDLSVDDMEIGSPERLQDLKDIEHTTPARQSARTAGKRFNFADVPTGEKSAENANDMPTEANGGAPNTDQNPSTEFAIEDRNSEDIQNSTVQAPLSSLSKSDTKEKSRTSLVQASISTLFKKVEQKITAEDLMKMTSSKVSNKKTLLNSSVSKNKNAKVQVVVQATELTKEVNISRDKKAGANADRTKRKAEVVEVEDDIEEFASGTEETDGSDDDWQASESRQ